MGTPTARNNLSYKPDVTRKGYTAPATIISAVYRRTRVEEGSEEPGKPFIRLSLIDDKGNSLRSDMHTSGGAADISKETLTQLVGAAKLETIKTKLTIAKTNTEKEAAKAALLDALVGIKTVVSVVPQVAYDKSNGGKAYNANGDEIVARDNVNIVTSDGEAGDEFLDEIGL